MTGELSCEELRQSVKELERKLEKLKHTEKALQLSENRYRTLVEASPDVIFSIAPEDGTFIALNSAFEKITGWSRDEWIGKPFTTFIHPDDVNVAVENFKQASLGNQTLLHEVRFLSKSGEYLVGEIVDVPESISGKVNKVFGFARDVTERKRARAELRRSEEKHRLLIENLPGIVYRGHQDWSVEFIDEKIKTLCGYHMSEFNSGQLKWSDLVVRQDIGIVRESFVQALKSDKSYVREYRINHKAGETVWIQDRGQIICNTEGEIEYVSGIFFDISERKQAEDALRESENRFRVLYQESKQREQLYESLLNSTPDAVAIYNLIGETVYINPAFTRIFGFTLEDVKNNRIPYVPESEIVKTKAGIERILSGEQIPAFETKRLTKDGRVLDITLSSSCYLDHEGRLAGIVVVLRDVTAAKLTEKQLIHAQKMEAVGTLAGGIAHDFNNLLQAIQGYTQLLLLHKPKKDPEIGKLRKIEKAANSAGELTRQLLTFSSKIESRLRPLDLNVEVKKVQKLLKRTIPKMIDIELCLDDNLKIIDADPVQIEQVLMNLAVNARDSMPEDGKLIINTANVSLFEEDTRSHPEAKPGDYVLLTVSDTGHGMDKETLEHIFEPFFTTKGTGKGTGLGLSMVYGLVKNHNGHIECYSEPGNGTTFKLYFPEVKKVVDKDPHRQKSASPLGGSEIILMVDDEKYIRDIGEEVLSKFGYTVITASNGESALKIYREKQAEISLIILDLIMPGMGGRRCFEEILKVNPSAKVVIASGYAADGLSKEALAAGVRNFVGKPYDFNQMLEVVRKVLDDD